MASHEERERPHDRPEKEEPAGQTEILKSPHVECDREEHEQQNHHRKVDDEHALQNPRHLLDLVEPRKREEQHDVVTHKQEPDTASIVGTADASG